MKYLTALTLALSLLLAGVTRAAPSPAAVDAYDVRSDEIARKADRQHDELILAQERLRVSEAANAKALEADAKTAADHKAEVDGVKRELADAQRTLGKWYVRLVLAVVRCIFWVGIGGGVLGLVGLAAYATAFVGGFMPTTSLLFHVAQGLKLDLPLSRFIDNFHPTRPVRIQEVPVVDGAIIKPAPQPAAAVDLAEVVRQLKAMTAAQPPAPVPTMRAASSPLSTSFGFAPTTAGV